MISGPSSVQSTVTRVRDSLVVNVQADLTEEVLDWLRTDLLGRVETTSARGVVLDFSGLSVIDATEFEAIRKLVQMVELLGPPCVIAGLNAGIVSYLVTVGAELSGIRSTLGLDEALDWLSRLEGVA